MGTHPIFESDFDCLTEPNEIDCRHPLAICARLVRRCDGWFGAEADQQIVRRSPSQSRSHLWQWQWTTVGDRFQGRDRLELVLVAQGHRSTWLCTRSIGQVWFRNHADTYQHDEKSALA